MSSPVTRSLISGNKFQRSLFQACGSRIQAHGYYGNPLFISRHVRQNSSFARAISEGESLVQPTTPLNDPFSMVSHEMQTLARNIASLIGSGHPTLNRVGKYYFESEGKKVRPLIVLLISKALSAVPIEERDRGSRDENDVIDEGKSFLPGPSVNASISPLRILHGINPGAILNPLSRPSDPLPEEDLKNGILPKQRRLAEIVEMIHTASLLHDDVIDHSDTRRGRPTGNVAFTNKMAVLAGDFLLGRASVAIARIRNPEVIELLSTTIANLVEGEFMQLKNTVVGGEQGGPTMVTDAIDVKASTVVTVSKEEMVAAKAVPKLVMNHDENVAAAFEYYIHKTYLKTASLMSKSCRAAAVLSGSRENVVDASYEFGRNLGLCFQVVDDMLDYTVNEEQLGKPAGADLKLGLATAPVLFAWKKFPEVGAMIKRKFDHPGDVEAARKYVTLADGLSQTREMAEKFCSEALKNLYVLPPSEARNSLEYLTRSVLSRSK